MELEIAIVLDIDVKVFHLGRILFLRGSHEINKIKSLPTGTVYPLAFQLQPAFCFEECNNSHWDSSAIGFRIYLKFIQYSNFFYISS